jgi:3-keto-5-aminohexanoate cleavage enzyme
VIVAVAPNGGRKTKADHPALPLSPDELARTAAECLERGASMIHLHVRDKDGGHCLDPEAYRTAIARICEEVGDRLVLQITSESLGRYSPAQQRSAVLRTNPEAVSLALRELAPEKADEKDFGLFLGKLKQMRIWPQTILYNPDEAERLGAMMNQGLIPFDKLSVLYVLGRFALTRTAIPRDLLPYLASDMPRFESWSVCAFGHREAACVAAGALLGGHGRVGFENNLKLPNGAHAPPTPTWSARPRAPSKRSGSCSKAPTG